MERGLVGRIIIGYGEGRYYMSLKPYQKQFKVKLGFKPYEGTFNITARKTKIKNFLKGSQMIRIKGFKKKGATFGGLRCYKVKLNGCRIGLIMPDRTSYNPTVAELIAPFHIRNKFGLRHGDKITITK